MIRHHILIPLPDTRAAREILAGSGVVCADTDMQADLVLAYFEGNRYDATNLRTFAARVQAASMRLHTKYPTVARGTFHRNEFVAVGTFTFTEDYGVHLLALDPQASPLVEEWIP